MTGPRVPTALLESLKTLAADAIGQRVRAVTGSTASLQDFAQPAGDRGLFGPESMAWRVHDHFAAMMVGGLSSLMVQALHPRALAAVWDHSDFRHDLKGRLGRTAYFVAATTYGGQAQALRTIERVNTIHARVAGVDQQGQPYVANEPHLIRWVHLVEVTSFLAAYQYLSRSPLSAAECDQYIAEMTRIGHLLGAEDLPTTLRDSEQALAAYRDELAFDARTREIMQVIESYPVDGWDQPFMAMVLQAAFDVMPAWALGLLHKTPACALQQQALRRALQAGAEPVQWMLGRQGVAATARRRVQGVAHSAV